MEPQNIKGILENLMKRLGMDEKLEECQALLLWDDVAKIPLIFCGSINCRLG